MWEGGVEEIVEKLGDIERMWSKRVDSGTQVAMNNTILPAASPNDYRFLRPPLSNPCYRLTSGLQVLRNSDTTRFAKAGIGVPFDETTPSKRFCESPLVARIHFSNPTTRGAVTERHPGSRQRAAWRPQQSIEIQDLLPLRSKLIK